MGIFMSSNIGARNANTATSLCLRDIEPPQLTQATASFCHNVIHRGHEGDWHRRDATPFCLPVPLVSEFSWDAVLGVVV